jgi:hypothetical protein
MRAGAWLARRAQESVGRSESSHLWTRSLAGSTEPPRLLAGLFEVLRFSVRSAILPMQPESHVAAGRFASL